MNLHFGIDIRLNMKNMMKTITKKMAEIKRKEREERRI